MLLLENGKIVKLIFGFDSITKNLLVLLRSDFLMFGKTIFQLDKF